MCCLSEWKTTDGAKQIDWLARKIANLRVFEDENGKMNRSIHDVDGSVLSISQFTLYADVRKGNRPSFVKAGAPDARRTDMARDSTTPCARKDSK